MKSHLQQEPRKLVFVNRFFHPDESATSLMLTDLVEHLAGAGYRILVITGRSEYQRTLQDEGQNARLCDVA